VPSIYSNDRYIPVNTVYKNSINKELTKSKSFVAASTTLKPRTPVLALNMVSMLLFQAGVTWFHTSINIRIKLPRNPERSPFSFTPAGLPCSHSILSARRLEEVSIITTLKTYGVLLRIKKINITPSNVSTTN